MFRTDGSAQSVEVSDMTILRIIGDTSTTTGNIVSQDIDQERAQCVRNSISNPISWLVAMPVATADVIAA